MPSYLERISDNPFDWFPDEKSKMTALSAYNEIAWLMSLRFVASDSRSSSALSSCPIFDKGVGVGIGGGVVVTTTITVLSAPGLATVVCVMGCGVTTMGVGVSVVVDVSVGNTTLVPKKSNSAGLPPKMNKTKRTNAPTAIPARNSAYGFFHFSIIGTPVRNDSWNATECHKTLTSRIWAA